MSQFIFNKFNDLIGNKLPAKSGAKGNGRFAVATSIGLVRKQNEDRCALFKARFGESPASDFNLAIVCDGLGGMEAGQDAAVLGLATFASSLIEGHRVPAALRLQDALNLANRRIYSVLRGRGGTTLTAAFITRYQGSFVCHAGDSRLYTIGPERSLHQLTRDDTLASALRKEEDDFRRDNRLLQFVGIGEELDPHIQPIMVHGTASLLLTTDGAHDFPLRVMEKVVSAASSPLDLTRKLTQLSDMLGGADNSSAVILPSWLDDDSNPGEGLELTLMVPGEEFTILLPSFSERGLPFEKRAAEPKADAQATGATKKTGIRRRITEPRTSKTTKSTSNPRKKRRTPPKRAVGEELPLEGSSGREVNVEFQNKSRSE